VGPRGSGSWKRIGWDEALGEIAGSLVDTLARRGGEGVVCELGGNMDFGQTFAGTLRFVHLLGAPVTDSTAHVGDLPVGGTITLGAGFTGGSSDDWFRSDYLVLWAFNPSATRIPDAHFLNEARYRGARVVSITPDYGPSAVHSDLWLSPRRTRRGLALSACRVISTNLFGRYIRKNRSAAPRADRHAEPSARSDVVGQRDDRFESGTRRRSARRAPGSPDDWSPRSARVCIPLTAARRRSRGRLAPVQRALVAARAAGDHARSGVDITGSRPTRSVASRVSSRKRARR
jgi:nitrate reductase alpha subunit